MSNRHFFEIDIRARKSFINKSHHHDFLEIYCLSQGSCNYFIDNRIYSLIPHDILFIQNGAIHNAVYPPDKPHKRILISFSEDYIAPSLREDAAKIFKRHFYRPPDCDFTEDIFKKLYSEYIDGGNISQALICCYLTELFAHIARNAPSDAENDILNKSNDSVNIAVSDAARFITENYSQNITLAMLADMAGYSESYFSRLFKTSTGFGYKDFIQTVRLKAAKELLSEGNDSVCGIAFKCGFSDSNYFSSVFKRSVGMSPLKYRKVHHDFSDN